MSVREFLLGNVPCILYMSFFIEWLTGSIYQILKIFCKVGVIPIQKRPMKWSAIREILSSTILEYVPTAPERNCHTIKMIYNCSY